MKEQNQFEHQESDEDIADINSYLVSESRASPA